MNRDHALVAAALAIIGVIFLPLPAAVVDLLLVASFVAATWMLCRAILAKEPLEFASFPSLLLVSTAFRLALSIATTRLVLTRAPIDGTYAAGRVIRFFGDVVAGAEPVIGAVLFAILIIVNFAVISKGATRISEVAARFMLDALPGRQAAIDADSLSPEEATRRRDVLARESEFFGAMDGATKFIRGDAVAAIVIVLVNVVGGLVIGVLQQGMPLAKALHTYTLLTIGDGLVMQLPALLVSLGAGMLVTQQRRTTAAAPKPATKRESMESLLRVEPLEVQVGVGLVALVQGGLVERFAQLRRDLAAELGIIVPSVRVRDTMALRPTEYEIRLRGEPVHRGQARLNAAALTQIVSELRDVVRRHAAELLTRDDVALLLKALKETNPALVEEVVPALVKPAELQQLLQGLLREGVPVRDLAAILESCDGSKEPAERTERARAALSRTIVKKFAKDGVLRVVAVDPEVEDLLLAGRTASVTEKLARETDKLVLDGRAAVVICRASARPLVKRLADAARPGIAVLSYAEIPAGIRVETAGVVKAEAESVRT